MRALIRSLTVLLMALAGLAEGQVTAWKLGGSGLEWSEVDTSQVFIDFETTPGAIQPVYFTEDRNILSQRPYWSPFKFPTDIGYEDGMIPRVWRAANGWYWYTAGALTTAWVDGDSISYSPSISRGITSEWYTFDVGVPVPADQVGFYPPPRGFRADGTPLREDIFPSFEISVSEEADPVLNQENGDADYHRLSTLVADVPRNFDAHVKLDFPKQYVRFIRFQRKEPVGVETVQLTIEQQGGTIGEFELKGDGVAKRVIYLSKIVDLGREVNFGRVMWQTTPMRMTADGPVEVDDAAAYAEFEVRSGRDDDPNLYHEYTDTGAERVVTRERFENEIKSPTQTNAGAIQEGKPGLRASIKYDTENWTYWSYPLKESGASAPLERGRFLQVRVRLQSRAYTDFIRVDSLWVELAPPLARQVIGEVARLDEPQPTRGFAEVELGETTDFIYDISAQFSSSTQGGFDVVRIRTGSRPHFVSLEMGDPLEEIEPLQVEENDEDLVVYLPQKVTRTRNQPIRVRFSAEVFVFANTFTGEVLDTETADLPQQIEGGDVSNELSTNSLRVLGIAEKSAEVIKELRFSSSVVTPNGDGVNDRLDIAYTLFRLPGEVPVELKIYGLNGILLTHLEMGAQGAGPQQISWDGRDDAGELLPPGIYLVEVSLDSEYKTFRHMQPVGVAF